MMQVLTAVCKEFGVRSVSVLKHGRRSELVEARQVAFYLTRNLLRSSYRQIGIFYGRDHTTIGFGCRAVVHRLRTDSVFSARVSRLKDGLKKALKKAPKKSPARRGK